MQDPRRLLSYIRRGIDNILLLEGVDDDGRPFTGGFFPGRPLRPTQKAGLEAYRGFLDDPDTPPEDKLTGFFAIPTGIGKTAMFIGILREAVKEARKDGIELSIGIVVPTVNLLAQTKKEFISFAPDLENDIGLYGDGRKNFGKPITIMTYNAWTDLVESGVMHGGNTDILISDEAHRGTSDRRHKNFLEAFEGSTVSLAFTATYKFDETKSVELTHKNNIFERTLKEAVENGELARYINPVRKSIRAEIPPEHEEQLRAEIGKYLEKRKETILTRKFRDAVERYGGDPETDDPEDVVPFDVLYKIEKDNGNGFGVYSDAESLLSFETRKAAWNIEVANIFAEDIDEITGDPLTDNQAGFFVADTKQADKLEELLNADPRLVRKAAAQGRKGVAVAIHSNMSAPRQRRRMREYQNGEWLAVIGDEKFKEGFDHPPMKTVFDWEHISVVDKAQILGRGARKWWNPAKARWEGLTFIDTAVYFGGQTLDMDETRKSIAWGRVTTARAVLEGEFIYDIGSVPKEEEEEFEEAAKRKKYGFALQPPQPDYGRISASSYSEESGIYMYLDDRQPMEVNEEALAVLKTELEKRRLTIETVFKRAARIPEGFSPEEANGWFGSGGASTERRYWFWLAGEIVKYPSYIKMDKARRGRLAEEMERHELTAEDLVKNAYYKPKGLSARMIGNWLSGKTPQARESYYLWALKEARSHPVYIDLNDELREEISMRFNETRFTPALLLGTTRGSIPEGLTSDMIDEWIGGRAKTVREDLWQWVIKALARRPAFTKLDDEKRAHIKSEIERTGISPKTLLEAAGSKPRGLSPAVTSHWLRSAGKIHARTSQLGWLMESYAALPDKENAGKPGNGRQKTSAPRLNP